MPSNSSPPDSADRPTGGPVRKSFLIGIVAIVAATLFLLTGPLKKKAPVEEQPAAPGDAIELPSALTDGSTNAVETAAHSVTDDSVHDRSPFTTPARRTSLTQPLPHRQLATNVASIGFAGGVIRADQPGEWKQTLQQLTQQGAASLPAIRQLLAFNADVQFSGTTNSTTMRLDLLDALRAIGGPDATALATQTLQTTADPREIARLARLLEEQEPGQHRQELLNAAREGLQLAAAGRLSAQDVGPLFGVLQQYGDAGVLADLEGATGQWKYYSTIALAGLPDDAGLPALIQMAKDPQTRNHDAAVEMLAQVSARSPDATAALLQEAHRGQISNRSWHIISAILAGEQMQIGQPPPNSADNPGQRVTSYHLALGGQNFYSEPVATGWTAEQIDQRVALIDQLLAASPNPAAAALLQQSRAALLARPR